MFKKMLSALSMGAVALSIFFAKGVKADQLVEENSSSEDATAQNAENHTSTSEVTQGEVEAAKTALDQANQVTVEGQEAETAADQAVAVARNQLQEAQQNIETAESAVQSAPEALKKVQEDIESKEIIVQNAQAELANRQNELGAAQSEAEKQAQSVAASQEKVATAESKVNQAKSDVDAAKTALTISNSDAITNLENAKEKVSASQAAVDKAKQNLEKANQSENDRQKKLAEAATNKSKADDEVVATKQKLDGANARADKAQSELETAAAALNAAKAANNSGSIATSNNKNTFYMTPEYISALKQLADPNTPQSQISQIEETLKAVNDKAKSYNNYVADPTDSQTLIDTNNIPYDVRLQLSQFASELINQIRAQMGTGETVVTPSALDFADKVAREYKNDNWSWDLMNRYHHDAWGINRVAREYGLITTSSEQEQQGVQYYENAYIWKANKAQMSLADMKHDIYSSLVEFMYNGYEWLHAKSISGLNTGSQKNYLGVDFSMESDITVAHFTMVSEDQVSSASKNNFNATPIVSNTTENTGTADPEKLSQAQAAYDSALVANNEAKANKEEAQSAYDKAQLAATQAQSAFEEASQTPLDVSQAQKDVEDTEKQLAADKDALIQAQEVVNNIDGDRSKKEAELAKAEAELTAAQNNLVQAQDEISKKQKELEKAQSAVAAATEKRDSAQAELSKAQSSLEEAKKNLANLEQAEENLSKAKAALDIAKQEVSKAEAVQAAARKRLVELKAAQAAAQATYDRLSAQLNSQKAQERDDHYRRILDQTEKNLESQAQSKQQSLDSNNLNDPQSLSMKDKKSEGEIQILSRRQEHSNVSNKYILPNTGMKLSILNQISGIILISASFILFSWKKREEK